MSKLEFSLKLLEYSLKYVDTDKWVYSSEDGTMRVCRVDTGAHTEKRTNGGSFAFSRTALRSRRWASTVSPSRTTSCSSQKASRWYIIYII